MKKYAIILICFLLLFTTGCRGIQYEEGIYHNKAWEDVEFPFNAICIPDKDTAISIATRIVRNFQKDGYFINYVVQSVFYDTEDEIWIIHFWENNRGISASFSIALRAENAQVIQMWVEGG